jgi:tetratricopeptide (TPR) repeat protein
MNTIMDLLRAGRAALDQHNFAKALAPFDDALSQQHSHPEAHAGRAEALFGLRRYDDAIEAWEHALSLAPERLEWLYLRGLAHYENNDNEPAIEDLTAFL